MGQWQRYNEFLLRETETGISLDISRMAFPGDFFSSMEKKAQEAFAAMKALEEGVIANPDEDRQVGHYWLRDASLAPDKETSKAIKDALAQVETFAKEIQTGQRTAPGGHPFRHLLLIGIGGSALGPQLVADALGQSDDAIEAHFFDNTDPDGIARILADLGESLKETLVLVVSKSGGTDETYNGMLEAKAAFEAQGLDFPSQAVAITGAGSRLSKLATKENWITEFPMWDWVGGRTSVTSTVGLVPAAIQGLKTGELLEGARLMDSHTRQPETKKNAAMLLALMWHHAGQGRGSRDMVILPYKDRLVLFSKYLQQLVMESLGKERDLDGQIVNQGIAVYGNKGSTDQHAYVQQLRDGVNNFFATFIEVRENTPGPSLRREPDRNAAGDYLSGFLRGTRTALSGSGRESITISTPDVSARTLGALIALFERAVGFYATMIHINAYHQPGVEAGKKAAGTFLENLNQVASHMEKTTSPVTADEVAGTLDIDPEEVYHCLTHLAANQPDLAVNPGDTAAADRFARST
ncbi:MAG: glucose-6-phosphate isomerase [Verrucomicrobiota bacterium]